METWRLSSTPGMVALHRDRMNQSAGDAVISPYEKKSILCILLTLAPTFCTIHIFVVDWDGEIRLYCKQRRSKTLTHSVCDLRERWVCGATQAQGIPVLSAVRELFDLQQRERHAADDSCVARLPKCFRSFFE